MSKQSGLHTIWEVPDDLWEGIEPVITELDPPQGHRAQEACPCKMHNAIIFRMRSGYQWNRLPKHLGDDSTIHLTFQRWESAGVFPRVWAVIQTRCDELGGVDWEWQSADASVGKARLGGCNWPQPDRPRQAGDQAQFPRRGQRWATEHRGGRSQCPRYQAVGGDSEVRGGRASSSKRRSTSASVSGQGI